MKLRSLIVCGLAQVAISAVFADTTPPVASTPTVVSSSTVAPIVIPSTGIPFVNPDPGVRVLTLKACIEQALDRATSVLRAKNALETSGTQLLQAYFEFLPDLNASASYSYVTGRNYVTLGAPTTIDTTNRGGNYQVTSTLNIFNGFADLGGFRSSVGRRRYAKLTLERAKQQIILDVTQVYLQVLLDRQIVRIGEGNLQSSRERQRLLQAQTQVGMRSLTDLYRQEAQTSADELYLINARNRARTDLIQLLRRIRVDLMDPYDVADEPMLVPPPQNPFRNEQQLLVQALQQRPDLAAAQSLAKASQWDVVTARSGYFPRLDLSGNLAGTGRTLNKQIVNGIDVVPPDQDSLGHQWAREVQYTVGATLNWGLFNRYLTRLGVARSEEISKNASIDAQDTRLQVEGEIEQAINDYSASLDQVGSADSGLKAAQQSFDAVQARYKVGASSILDLLIAQSVLVQAQASQAQAQIAFNLQSKTMLFALGTLSN